MAAISRIEEREHRQAWLGLAWLLVGLAACALVLYRVAGPPHLPERLPSWDVISATLRGSYLPPEVVAYVLTSAAWLVWLWIVASLVLRLLVGLADALTRGAAWVRALRALSDRVTLPIVRRVVDGALVAIVVVNLAVRSPASVSAASLEPTVAVVVAASPGGAPAAQVAAAQSGEEQGTIEYTVQPGDTLWAISERFYGTGYEFPRLVSANAGRVMPDGRRFTQAGVINPGWVLLVPLPSRAVEQADGCTYYVVEPGDTLRGIAARLLGDEARWPELFDLNRGTARVDGRVFADPDLIWPGLRLRLPGSQAAPGAPPPAAPAPPAPSPAPPAAAPPSPTASPTSTSPPEPTPAPASPSPVTSPPPIGRAEPTSVPTSPTPAATATAPAPTADATPAVALEPEPAAQGGDGAPSPLVYGAAGLTAAALAGGAALLMRRRVRRSLDEPPIPPAPKPKPAPGDDCAEAELARVLTHRLHGGEVEPAVVVAEQARRFLAEEAVDTAVVALAYQGRNAVTLLLRASLAEQPRLLELATPFAARLGGAAQATVTAERDVVWRLTGLKIAGLLTPGADRPADPLALLAVGVAPSRETVYANWRALGHVLVAGLPGGGTDVVLTTLVAALAARCRPDELRLSMIASRRTLPRQLVDLPHQCGEAIDPEDDAGVRAVLAGLRAELVRRIRSTEADGAPGWQPSPDQPELVLVLGELDALEDDGTTLELIGAHGPPHGVRLLAATSESGAFGEEVLPHFTTRLVLQTLDDDESIHLLGRPEAADLGSGELLLRVKGREPVRLRGFRVSAERLDELVRLTREAYGGRWRAAAGAAPDLDEPGAGAPPPDEEPPTSGDEELVDADANGALAQQLEWSAADEGPDAEVVCDDEPAAVPDEAPAGEHGREAAAKPEDRPVAREAADAEPDPMALVDVEPLADAAPSVNAVEAPIVAMPAAAAVPREQALVAPSPAEAARAGPSEEVPGNGSLLQIRCLGGFVVRSGEQEIQPVGEEGGAYKAWEVLAFLACQPGMAASKEKLLTAVWPDIDEERAANRMRVAMARLRGLLARQVTGLTADVVRCERDGTCRLDPTLVWSDAAEFLALCRSATKLPSDEAKLALEQARTLYHGDLLSGRSTRFYDWIDERGESGISPRDRYREEYCRATQRLARLYLQEGQPALAVPLYKNLLKAEPTLEDVARELYRCYQRLGDLSSLIREDRHLRQALREAYADPSDPNDDPEQYQPEPETVELFNRIRAELEARALAGAGDENQRDGKG